jgi:hypothetical protein
VVVIVCATTLFVWAARRDRDAGHPAAHPEAADADRR